VDLSPDPSGPTAGDSVLGRRTTLLSLLSLLESPTFKSTTGVGGGRFAGAGMEMQMRLEGGGATVRPRRALVSVVPAATVSKDIRSPKKTCCMTGNLDRICQGLKNSFIVKWVPQVNFKYFCKIYEYKEYNLKKEPAKLHYQFFFF